MCTHPDDPCQWPPYPGSKPPKEYPIYNPPSE